jgi:polysaccharide biosynthesis/export protein
MRQSPWRFPHPILIKILNFTDYTQDLVKFRYLILLCWILSSCASYKQNIMFKPSEGFVPDKIQHEALAVEKNYVIQKNDWLKLEVFTNKGERLIDPNPELTNTPNVQTTTEKQTESYLVDLEGLAKFPMVGVMKMEGFTLRQAEEILQKEYANYFKEPFVLLSYVNKRVIVLGATGGQVLPLTNQNVTLVEVLAMAKGLSNDAKANNIRILRDQQVFIVDLSTIEGFKAGNILIQPGDIVYVEPIRKPLSEGLRDYGILLSLLLSVTTLIVLVNRT